MQVASVKLVHSTSFIAVTMDLMIPAVDQKVLFCPVASLFSLSTSAHDDEESKLLAGCFNFNSEVAPGWIGYKPDKITVITANDMFSPTGKNCDIVHPKKQMIRVRKQDDISALEALLEKPVLMCVTRRQHCGTSVDLSPPDTENCRKFRVSGFDIDFAIIFPPALLKQALKETLELVHLYVTKKQRFCLKIDLKKVLKELIPHELQDADSLEYVSWHNTAFWLTNYSKPHHSLVNVNNLLFWTALFPFAFFAALPYRAGRRLLCKDERLLLRNPMKFTVGDADDQVVVCLWSNDAPPPGEYNKFIDRFSMSTARLSWLAPFLRTSDMIAFNFQEEDEDVF